MSDIKAGDTVICIDSDLSGGALRLGNEYVVERIVTDSAVMIDGRVWDKTRFRKPVADETSGPVVRHIGLGFMRTGDSRSPMHMRLMIQNANWDVEVVANLDEHQFAALLAGQNITVECEL